LRPALSNGLPLSSFDGKQIVRPDPSKLDANTVFPAQEYNLLDLQQNFALPGLLQ